MSAVAISFLQSVGLTTEQAQELLKEDSAPNIEQLSNQVATKVWDRLVQHPEFGVKLQKQERAEVNGKWFSQVRKTFGLPEDEETAKKDIGELLSLGLQRKEVELKNRYTVESQGEAAKEVIQLREEKEKLEQERRRLLESEIPSIKAQVDNERKIVRIENRIRDRILSRDMVSLSKEAVDAMAMPFLMERLQSDYTLELDPKDINNIILRDRKTNDLPYQSNGNTLTIDDVIGTTLRSLNMYKEVDGEGTKQVPESANTTRRNDVPSQKPSNAPYSSEAKAHLERLRAAASKAQ